MALDQWCAVMPGTFDGYERIAVGTTHDTSPMSSEPPDTGTLLGPAIGCDVGLQPLLRHFEQLLQRARERLVVLRPLRHSDGLDVALHRERQRPVEVARPRGADDAPRQRRVGHQRRAFRDSL